MVPPCSQHKHHQHKVTSNSNPNMVEGEIDRKNWVLLHGRAKEIARDV